MTCDYTDLPRLTNVLSYEEAKPLWDELEDVLFVEAKDFYVEIPDNMDETTLVLAHEWRGFEAGTSQFVVWAIFAQKCEKGVFMLLMLGLHE